MIIPQRVVCDFCGNDIKAGDYVVAIDLPLSPSLRRELADDFNRQMQAAVESGGPGVIVMPFGGVPERWRLTGCAPCLFGILPDAREKVTAQVRAHLQERTDSERRASQAARDLEDDHAPIPFEG